MGRGTAHRHRRCLRWIRVRFHLGFNRPCPFNYWCSTELELVQIFQMLNVFSAFLTLTHRTLPLARTDTLALFQSGQTHEARVPWMVTEQRRVTRLVLYVCNLVLNAWFVQVHTYSTVENYSVQGGVNHNQTEINIHTDRRCLREISWYKRLNVVMKSKWETAAVCGHERTNVELFKAHFICVFTV